jgi:hypothetical protein
MSAEQKIIKVEGVQPTELELSVAQALFDLENNVADLKKELRALQISSAKEVILIYKMNLCLILIYYYRLKSDPVRRLSLSSSPFLF